MSQTVSQVLAIQRFLAKGNTLTPLQALRRFGTFRLASRIKELRDQHWPVKTEMVKIRGKRVASYRFEK